MSDGLGKIFKDVPVLVTGHTGFKGSWLSIWLKEIGATVIGYSLEPPSTPSNFQVSCLAGRMIDVRGDIRDSDTLRQTIQKYRPKVIFHLAAQPILLRSFEEPKEAFDVNVGGTVNILEAVRTSKSVRVVVCITSDKCYENQEWIWGYRENDLLGGHDPYSASKAMAELAIASYRQSFFSKDAFQKYGVAITSTRAGNVIGGGDWAPHRLVPDCMRALMAGKPIQLRNPRAVRPWQHVLEPLSGYLWLAGKLLKNGNEFAEAWNFGPLERQGISAEDMVRKAIELWGGGSWNIRGRRDEVETGLLRLNWDKAANRLNWFPTYTWEEALAETVSWFKEYQKQQTRSRSIDMYDICARHITEHTKRARERNIEWAK